MLRNLAIIVFFLSIIVVIFGIFIFQTENKAFFYFVTFFTLTSSTLIYPKKFQLTDKTTFLKIPLSIFLVFGMGNVLFFHNYSESLSLINFIAGLCAFWEYWRLKKTSQI